MKTVTLPSGQTCRPYKLRGAYSGIREFRAYDEVYQLARRISGNRYTGPDELWERNPWVVSSVVPSDLAEYNPEIHQTPSTPSAASK